MPYLDLRQNGQMLDPLAPFKALAVICHPQDSTARERMVGHALRESGVGQPRRRPLSAEAFMTEVKLSARRATIAGHLLLTMIQLHYNGHRASLNTALPLVRAMFPPWEQPIGPYWSSNSHIDHRPLSKTKMLRAYNDYRSVAHLVAAMLHGLQHDRQDIWPGTPGALPTFIAYAEALLTLAQSLPPLPPKRQFAIAPSEAWHIIIPQPIIPVELQALPLNAMQERILNEVRQHNSLS